MRKLLLFFMSLSFICPSYLFGQINEKHNRIRIGDEIIKQQVEFKEPGEAGVNLFWDFGDLKTINDSYSLIYSAPSLIGDSIYIMGYDSIKKKDVVDDELIVGTEHNTMYYYRLKDGILYLLGHENPSVKFQYLIPIESMRYPTNFGENEKGSAYISKGLYSSTVKMQTSGTSSILPDAFGKMVLPTGDTISPVLRIKTVKTIGDNIEEPKTRIETYQWYTKGYRYPIFETIEGTNLVSNARKFATSFYYPPQEHLYLETDPDNLALIEESWNKQKEVIENKADAKAVELSDIMTCKMYPNPVISTLNLEYTMKEDAKVSFLIYSLDGNLMKKIDKKQRSKGDYYETLDCSSLPNKTYILRIVANDTFINEKLLKR